MGHEPGIARLRGVALAKLRLPVSAVIDLPDCTSVFATLADPRFVVAAAVAALAGFLRGFSGFGSALVYIPLVSAVYEPKIAAGTLLMIDFCCSAPFTVSELQRCHWREVLPIGLAAALAVPFGTMALVLVDPVSLRWFIAALVLTLLVPLAAGWRYRGRPILPVSIAVGVMGGLGAGAVQIAGPPVILYWLGGPHAAAAVRANLMVFFLFTGAMSCIAYVASGVLTQTVITLAILLGIPFLIAMWVGARWFRGSSELTYRHMAYLIVAAAAVMSLPVFDGVLR
jgi:uncharacterized membrane protein YfcA